MDSQRSVSRLLCLCLLCILFHALDCLAQNSPEGPTALSPFRGLTIERTGGFIGTHDEWYFSEKGVRTTADSASVQKPVDKLRRLRQLVALKHTSHQDQVPSVPVCFDCFTFRVTVWYDGGHQTLEVAEVTGKADAEVIELLGLVRELIRPNPWPTEARAGEGT